MGRISLSQSDWVDFYNKSQVTWVFFAYVNCTASITVVLSESLFLLKQLNYLLTKAFELSEEQHLLCLFEVADQ